MRSIILILLLLGLSISGEELSFRDAKFRVFRAKPKDVRLVWKGDDGKPLATFEKARQRLVADGAKIAMMMNGGIFEPGRIPSGLYVEDGQALRPLNLAARKGNFFLKPNGVFFIRRNEDGSLKAEVSSSAKAKVDGSVVHGVQSGPLLLEYGRVHPAFREDSPNRLLRNGVGVDKEGRVVFLITIDDTNLWTFAEAFRSLGCENALFLDGDISRMELEPQPGVRGNGYASIFAVVTE